METKQECEISLKDAAILAILKESMESAADRVIAERERKAEPKPHVFNAGHVYLLIGCFTLIALVVAGALSK